MCKMNVSDKKFELLNLNYKNYLKNVNNLSDKEKNDYIHTYNNLYNYYHKGGMGGPPPFASEKDMITYITKDITTINIEDFDRKI